MSAGRFALLTGTFQHFDDPTRARVLAMARRPDLADDHSAVDVRIHAAFHPGTPDDVRVELAADPSLHVRCSAVEAGLPPEAQRRWARTEAFKFLHRPCHALDDPEARRITAVRLATEGEISSDERAERLERLVTIRPLELTTALALAELMPDDPADHVTLMIVKLAMATLSATPDHPAGELLTTSPAPLAARLAASDHPAITIEQREACADRLIVDPLRAAAPTVPEHLSQLLAAFNPLPPAAHAQVVELLAAVDLTDESALLDRFFRTPAVEAEALALARTSRDPRVLHRLATDPALTCLTAAAILTNPAATTRIALKAVHRIDSADLVAVCKARPHDIEVLVALISRWAGMLAQLPPETATAVADELLAAIAAEPLGFHDRDRVAGFARFASSAGFAAMPVPVAHRVLVDCAPAAAWFSERVARLDERALEVFGVLAEDATGPLGAVLDAAEAAVAAPQVSGRARRAGRRPPGRTARRPPG